ncbi:MAG: hypothetical protein PWQ44_2179 [Methanolobus sp.]|jgi:hypothetical protein|nr:hypothetical protein [Methanolobus sp.]
MKKILTLLAVLISLVGMASAATTVELDETDFGCTEAQFDVTVTEYTTYVEWMVEIDPSIAPISSATGVQLAISDQTAPVFILGVMPGEGGIDDSQPAYKEYSGGWGPATNALPAGMSVTGNNADLTKATTFTIMIDKTVFECESFRWAMNVVIDDDNDPGPDNAQCKYPTGWGWSSPACDYVPMEISCDQGEIPEFPTVALPIAAIIGLAFVFQRRKD